MRLPIETAVVVAVQALLDRMRRLVKRVMAGQARYPASPEKLKATRVAVADFPEGAHRVRRRTAGVLVLRWAMTRPPAMLPQTRAVAPVER
jgi:hypothetical protein